MQVQIIGTSDVVDLNYIDLRTGVNWIADFVGNAGGFGSPENGLIGYDDEAEMHIATRETVDWWLDMVAQYQALDTRLADARREHGSEVVDAYLYGNGYGDYEFSDLPAQGMALLDDFEAWIRADADA
ncbi:hypothetical protein LJC59_00905 [Desulfovibrio sp. OttesenSCG-928-A18]|nr:hypothetical protein [Desulfovibrio sp. OttesenSCG-928-A18]